MPSSRAPTAIAVPLPSCSSSLGCWSPERLRCRAPRRASATLASDVGHRAGEEAEHGGGEAPGGLGLVDQVEGQRGDEHAGPERHHRGHDPRRDVHQPGDSAPTTSAPPATRPHSPACDPDRHAHPSASTAARLTGRGRSSRASPISCAASPNAVSARMVAVDVGSAIWPRTRRRRRRRCARTASSRSRPAAVSDTSHRPPVASTSGRGPTSPSRCRRSQSRLALDALTSSWSARVPRSGRRPSPAARAAGAGRRHLDRCRVDGPHGDAHQRAADGHERVGLRRPRAGRGCRLVGSATLCPFERRAFGCWKAYMR